MKTTDDYRRSFNTIFLLFVGGILLLSASACGGDDDCKPNCEGRECGDDGCGGICGTCEEGESCNPLGQCIDESCVPDCSGRECGPDPVCGQPCPPGCDDGETCNEDGQCIDESCVPDCSDRECGPDPVCGQPCPPGCDEGETCNEDGQCIEDKVFECGVDVPIGTGAEMIVATIQGSDFQVDGSGIDQTVDFTTDQKITGVGFTALWSGIVADQDDGIAPWSLDLAITVTAPDNSTIEWHPIGGEVSIADYPLQDFIHGFDCVDGNGTFTWSFTSTDDPWVAGLSDVRYHLTTEVPKVEQVFDGSVDSGPTWNRPFSIVGISGMGEVHYSETAFTVSVSGGYEIETVVDAGDTFNYIYQGGFDPDEPLENLLDYGLGNGYHYYETPAGTAFISVLLFEGETYHMVVSQWSPTSPGSTYVTNVTGPGEFITD